MYLLKTHTEYLLTCKSLLKTKLYLSYLEELPKKFVYEFMAQKRISKTIWSSYESFTMNE